MKTVITSLEPRRSRPLASGCLTSVSKTTADPRAPENASKSIILMSTDTYSRTLTSTAERLIEEFAKEEGSCGRDGRFWRLGLEWDSSNQESIPKLRRGVHRSGCRRRREGASTLPALQSSTIDDVRRSTSTVDPATSNV